MPVWVRAPRGDRPPRAGGDGDGGRDQGLVAARGRGADDRQSRRNLHRHDRRRHARMAGDRPGAGGARRGRRGRRGPAASRSGPSSASAAAGRSTSWSRCSPRPTAGRLPTLRRGRWRVPSPRRGTLTAGRVLARRYRDDDDRPPASPRFAGGVLREGFGDDAPAADPVRRRPCRPGAGAGAGAAALRRHLDRPPARCLPGLCAGQRHAAAARRPGGGPRAGRARYLRAGHDPQPSARSRRWSARRWPTPAFPMSG